MNLVNSEQNSTGERGINFLGIGVSDADKKQKKKEVNKQRRV